MDHFDILDFTEDLNKVKIKISKSVAIGGDDWAEDVIGALQEAHKLSFSA